MDDIAVPDDVFLALDAHLARLLGRCLAAEYAEVVEGDHLGADEAPLDVAVYLARRSVRYGTAPDGPRPALVGPDGHEADQVQQAVGGGHELQPRRLAEPVGLEELGLFPGVELGHLGLHLAAQRQRDLVGVVGRRGVA